MKQDLLYIKGKVIDEETRCVHYHSDQDIIAIKFYCCDTYYPCITCHQEASTHSVQVWPSNRFDEKAILCGKCKMELTINEYLSLQSACPNCSATFNKGCKLHHHFYFDVHSK
ncbi:CHY zinc finger protein [Pseudalkalibacillus hwajinpoensis]|uniref:CHY zinc finger protein n=1 Tax=Guptibacillus hwajinpoensis TaxID=208199 RepID=UPI00325B2C27